MPSSLWMGQSERDRVTQQVMQRAPSLALYARQWLDRSLAEDVVQEALTSLLCLGAMPEDPVAWMFRAVRNGAIDHVRASSRRRRREEAVAEARREWFEDRTDALIDAQTAEQALRRLPAEYREIVVMRIWGELRLAQIAAILGIGVTTVHERYESALQQLRAALEKPCPNQTS